MTERLPVAGSDEDAWGTILNGFLGVAHDTDGTLFNINQSSSDTDTYIDLGAATADTIKVYAGGVEMLRLVETTQDQFYVNPGGTDVDFIVGNSVSTTAFSISGETGVLALTATGDASEVFTTSGGYHTLDLKSYNDGSHCYIRGHSYGGTSAAPTDLITGRQMLTLEAGGYVNGALTTDLGHISFGTTGTVSTTACPTWMRFSTVPYGTATTRDHLALWPNGWLTLGKTSSPYGLFEVYQPTYGTGLVETAGTTALTGTETKFTSELKAGDTITVSGETSRVVDVVTSDTELTVTVAFSTTGTGKTFTRTAQTVLCVHGNGRVGIGTASPGSALTVTANSTTLPTDTSTPLIHMSGADASSGFMLVDSFGTNATIKFRRADGTNASKTAVQSTETLGTIMWTGYGASAYLTNSAVKLDAIAEENWTNSAGGCAFRVSTRATGGTGVASESMRVCGSGRVGIGTSAPDRRLEVNSADGTCLRLTYNDSNGTAANYVDLLVTSGGNGTITPSGGTLDVTGKVQCDSFQLDATPDAGSLTCDHYITITTSGGNYKIPCVAA